jgi:hypothetical protein
MLLDFIGNFLALLEQVLEHKVADDVLHDGIGELPNCSFGVLHSRKWEYECEYL